tara:strand:+ start:287 stop:862 length:576 start_codon:yes stop_codon:yes gene_type:complete
MLLWPLKRLHIAGATPFAGRPNCNQYLNGMLQITGIMERIQVIPARGIDMSIHGGEWRIHASAVDECEVIEESLSWLTGGESDIIIEKENSTLGAPMQTIRVKMKSKAALSSLEILERDSLVAMLENGIGSRVDEDKFLHIRLSLEKLVQGRGVVSNNSEESVAKGRFKLEVYPGQGPIEVAEDLLLRLIG